MVKLPSSIHYCNHGSLAVLFYSNQGLLEKGFVRYCLLSKVNVQRHCTRQMLKAACYSAHDVKFAQKGLPSDETCGHKCLPDTEAFLFASLCMDIAICRSESSCRKGGFLRSCMAGVCSYVESVGMMAIG